MELEKDPKAQILEPGDIEQIARYFICKLYDCDFKGDITVKKLSKGYTVQFGFPDKEKPVIISGILSDKQFCDYLKKQIQIGGWCSRYSYNIKREEYGI